jgi:putative ABC transport system substrate-binding protein
MKINTYESALGNEKFGSRTGLMGRLIFLVTRSLSFTMVFALFVLPTVALAQNVKVFRIGVIKIVSHAALDADEKGFEAALASSGFKEGINISFDRQNAQGDIAQADAIARKFVADGVDLIHSIATPTTQAVLKTQTTIPVVFSSVTDPVFAGIVPSDSAPSKRTGTNVTGVSDLWPVFLQLQTYSKFVPTEPLAKLKNYECCSATFNS